MSLSIAAGMSLDEFYRAETWEASVIVDRYLAEKDEEFKLRWELARFQMSAMTDTSNIKFPWELKHNNVSKEDWNKHLEQMNSWREKAESKNG